MSKTELYQPIDSMLVPCHAFRDKEIDRLLDHKLLPLGTDNLSQLALVATNENFSGNLNGPCLVQTTPYHRRSYEIRFGDNGSFIWADEYGNPFSSLTIKGSSAIFPQAYLFDISPSGFLIYGLQESDAIRRVLRVSKALRERKVETEIILGVFEPQQLPMNGEMVPLPEFKRRLIQQVWDENSNEEKDKITGFIKVPRKDIPKLSEALENMTFLFTLRGLPVSERLGDVCDVSTKEELMAVLKNSFRFVNTKERMKQSHDPTYTPDFFNVEKDEDIQRYFEEYLPNQIGTNYGRAHNLGIQKFTHSGNVTLTGGIPDLDSFRGEFTKCQDNKVYDHHTRDDLERLVEGFTSTLRFLHAHKFANFDEDKTNTALVNCFDSYLRERDLGPDTFLALPRVRKIFSNFVPSHTDCLQEYYTAIAVSKIGWDYQFMKRGPETLDKFLSRKRYWQKHIRQVIADSDKTGEQAKAEKASLSRRQKLQLEVNSDPILALSHFISQEIRSDFLPTRGKDLGKVSSRYGREVAIAVAELLLNREYDKITKDIDIEALQAGQANIYRRFVEDQGWEKNIFTHLTEIYDLFESFSKMCYTDSLKHYLSLIKPALSFDYQHPETFEEIVEKFHLQDQETYEKTTREELCRKLPTQRKDRLIKELLDPKTEAHHAGSRFIEFVSEYMGDKPMAALITHLEQSGQTLDEETLRVISFMFANRELHNLYEKVAKDKTGDKIHGETEKRLTALSEKFLQE